MFPRGNDELATKPTGCLLLGQAAGKTPQAGPHCDARQILGPAKLRRCG